MAKLPQDSQSDLKNSGFQRAEQVGGNVGASLLFGTLCVAGLVGVVDPMQDPFRFWIGGVVFVLSLIALLESLMTLLNVRAFGRTPSVQIEAPEHERYLAISASHEQLRASEYPPDGRDNLLRAAGYDSACSSQELLRANMVDAEHFQIV